MPLLLRKTILILIRIFSSGKTLALSVALLSGLTTPSWTQAAVLPEERVDITYHSYDGGGIDVTGPAVLVRKNFAGKVSTWARYYEDVVSGASIDVETSASPWEEKRKEYSLGASYLYDKTITDISYTNSDSGDYISDRLAISASHDFFGDLTTVALSFAVSDDQVFEAGDDSFEDEVRSQSYSLSLSQILTKNLIVGFTAQTITSEGFLNSPYRTVRFLSSDGVTEASQNERYPRIRNSDALAVRANYYLPYRASLRGEYRIFSDSWGIEASNARIDYIHPFSHFTLHLNVRAYEQTAADFYFDLFPFEDALNYLARDKELSTFTSNSFGLAIETEIPERWAPFGKKTTVSLLWDKIFYDYDDFRDARVDLPAGEEPFYSFDADAIRFSMSIFY